jgi:hypothetical protein
MDDVIRNTPDDPPDPINLTNVDAHVTNGFGFIEAIDVEPLLYRPRYSAVFPHPPAPINARNRQRMQDAFITDGKNRLIWFVAGEIGSRFDLFIPFVRWRDKDTHVADGIEGLSELDLIVLNVRGFEQFPFTIEEVSSQFDGFFWIAVQCERHNSRGSTFFNHNRNLLFFQERRRLCASAMTAAYG